MELSPITNTHIDLRLQEIDRQIHTALQDIRRNLEELEEASRKSGSPDATGKGFSDILRDAIDGAADTA